MQPDAAKIVTYFREPTWISANYEAQFTPEGKNFAYTEEQKRQLRENPEELFKLRKAIEHSLNHFFQAMLIDTPRQLGMADAIKELMQTRLNNNPELCAKLIPDWKAGCRRLTPGEGYLEALQEPNVSIESAKIERVDETGIQTATSHEDLDIIVCATGFDVSFTPSWKLIGKNNVNLAEQWRESPEAYLRICVPNIPNYFIFNGPNSHVGHGSLIAVMQWTAQYILRWCKKIATEDIKYVIKHALYACCFILPFQMNLTFFSDSHTPDP
jgi:cation diffusion facilitator CzcD-associated flavoprotein CzcO